jgi:tripartite-type tricarboxylate transporter receptor subunit TctC
VWPTAAEEGTPDLIAYTWNAIFLLKGAPEPIVKRVAASIFSATS